MKKGDVGMAKHFSKSTETRNELWITLYLQYSKMVPISGRARSFLLF